MGCQKEGWHWTAAMPALPGRTRRMLAVAWVLAGSLLSGLQFWRAFAALDDGYLPLPHAGAALVTASRSTEPVLFHVMLALLMLAALAIAVSVLRVCRGSAKTPVGTDAARTASPASPATDGRKCAANQAATAA